MRAKFDLHGKYVNLSQRIGLQPGQQEERGRYSMKVPKTIHSPEFVGNVAIPDVLKPETAETLMNGIISSLRTRTPQILRYRGFKDRLMEASVFPSQTPAHVIMMVRGAKAEVRETPVSSVAVLNAITKIVAVLASLMFYDLDGDGIPDVLEVARRWFT